MNASLPDSHPSIEYYDSDYPSKQLSRFPENFDAITEFQGLAHDVERFDELARGTSRLLELCCGTGRVALTLARAGHSVDAVDISGRMLDVFRNRLSMETMEVRKRIRLFQQDVTALDLAIKDYPLVIVPFNSLLCIPDFNQQCAAVHAAANHLQRGGRLALDMVNPLVLPINGDAAPKPFFTRRNTRSGNRYTRFAAMGPFDANQVQRLWGWYDEIDADGIVRRTDYEMHWRPIFRYEIELMLGRCGLRLVAVEGGHRHEPFTASSRKMFVIAER